MPRRKKFWGRKVVHWWNEGIAEARKKCLAARRTAQRRRKRRDADEATITAAENEHRLRRQQLRKEIYKSKEAAWREQLALIDKDPWGTPYKVCMTKLKPREHYHADVIKCAVQELFPPDEAESTETERDDTRESSTLGPRITQDEVKRALGKAKSGKSPGLDGITVETLRMVHRADPLALTETYNACIREKRFPKIWKEAKLVLLPKGDPKTEGGEQPKVRPLCLLNTAAKTLEKIITARIEAHLESGTKNLSANQYGSRRGMSTIDAIQRLDSIVADCKRRGLKCASISLDIRNAFNTARWAKIRDALRSLDVPEFLQEIIGSYLSSRNLHFNTPEGPEEKTITRGVPQGSVLGPLLWNIMFDNVLAIHRQDENLYTICYADDTILVAAARTEEKLVEKAEAAIARTIRWITEAGLEVAHHKTTIIKFGGATTERRTAQDELRVGPAYVNWSETLKYLGIILDRKSSYTAQTTRAADRARETTRLITGLMPNVGGPKQTIRRLIGRVAESVMLYAAPVWSRTMGTKKYSGKVDSAQRLALLREISGYRTVPGAAANVLARTPPAHLLIRERARIWSRREPRLPTETPKEAKRRHKQVAREERAKTLEEWQQEWQGSTTAGWTRRLIPEIREWLKTRGLTNYHITQALTGHGCFNAYLHRFGKWDNPE